MPAEGCPEGLRHECQPEALFKLYCLKIAQVLAFITPELALHVMITASHAEQRLRWKESYDGGPMSWVGKLVP